MTKHKSLWKFRRWESLVSIRTAPDRPVERDVHVGWHLTERAAARAANRMVHSPLVTASAMSTRMFVLAEVRRA